MRAIIFDARREAYSMDDVYKPMTVRELRSHLSCLDDEDVVIISHDNGYTYGSLNFVEDNCEIDEE